MSTKNKSGIISSTIFHSVLILLICVIFFNASPVKSAESPTVYWGAYINGGHYGTKPDGSAYKDAPYGIDTWDKFELNAGKKISVLQFGMPFKVGTFAGNFPTSDMEKIRQRGAIPFIGWGSWEVGTGKGVYQPEYKLTNITRGDFDPYIRKFAQDAKAWGKPFFLNLNHEQNLTGQFPWQYGAPITDPVTGASYTNTAQDFVDSWRHVHDIFSQEGVTNVTWVWVPNIYYISGSTAKPFMPSYPGDAYTDWVGFNGFNHANGANNKWDTFTELFDDSYKVITGARPDISPGAPTKPIMIMATASNEASGISGDNGAMKAAWIRDAFQVQIPQNYPKIKGVMWFNWNSRTENIVIESSQAAQSAFQQSIASSYYAANNFASSSGKINPLFVSPSSIPSPTPAIKPGDVDGNGTVDIFDYSLILSDFGKSGSNLPSNLDKIGGVDIFDYTIVLTNFGK